MENDVKETLNWLFGEYPEEEIILKKYIKDLKTRIDKLNKIINKTENFIQLKIIRYENEKDYILEPQDILDIYYYLKNLKEED